MKFGKILLSEMDGAVVWLLALIIAVSLMAMLEGCTSTVKPVVVRPKVPSLDGNASNSGLLGQLPDHSGILTTLAEARYEALAADYGKRFHPPVTGRECVPYTNGTFRIDGEHLAKFGVMDYWKRNNR